jgi:hypothetical protein
MGQFLSMMIETSKRGRGYAEKLMVGIRPEQAARRPHFESAGTLTVVDMNHPTFCFGHLAIYPAKMLPLVGIDPSVAAVPAGWTELFNAGVACQDDPEGRLYPRFDEVAAAFLKNMDAAYAALAKVDDALLSTPTANERYREFFPTTGLALNFLLTSHVMVHCGQVSAWRRCFGLPSAM